MTTNKILRLASTGLCLLILAARVSAPAGQQIIETDNPSVEKSGPGFFNMYIKYGRVGMGSGDYIVTTSGTNSSFRFTIPAGNRSVSAMFLFHNQGQIAEVYLDGTKRQTIDTFARSSVAQKMGGVVGQVREFLIASDLNPATTHKLEIVNTGRSSSDSIYSPRELNQGPQLAVDALRIGSEPFGMISGLVQDDWGRVLGNLRMTLSTPIGPLKDGPGKTVIYTDGFGRYSFCGLSRGSDYTLAISENIASHSTTVSVPVEGGETVKNITIPYLHICRPRMAVPAFALQGQSFEIEAEAAQNASNWKATLRNEYKSIDLVIDSAAYGPKNRQDRSKPGWLLQVKVPASTPLEVWDLELTCSLATRREPRCIKILDTFDRSFYIGQVTDVHCYGSMAAKNDLRTAQVLSTLDAVGARFIAITGDLCHFKAVKQAFDGFTEVLTSCSNTVTCVLPGNHDSLVQDPERGVSALDAEYNHDVYERLIGQPRYDFHMGSVYVVADDIFSGDPGWARGKLAAATSQDQIRLFLSHYHTLTFDRPPYPTIHLFGHNHVNQRLTNGVAPNTYPVISVAAVTDSNSKKHPNEFRLVRFNRDDSGHWSLGTFTYNGSDKNGVPEAEPQGGPITSFNIKRSYSAANDGTQTANTVTFNNRTAERFEHASARFVMTNRLYAVAGGKLVASYVSDDQTKRIVLVELDAAPNSDTTASIQPAETAH